MRRHPQVVEAQPDRSSATSRADFAAWVPAELTEWFHLSFVDAL